MDFQTQVDELRAATLKDSGVVPSTLRRAVVDYAATAAQEQPAGVRQIPAALIPYLSKVARHAYKVTDADINRLKALTYTEDEIFELTLSAALGAGLARLENGLNLLEA